MCCVAITRCGRPAVARSFCFLFSRASFAFSPGSFGVPLTSTRVLAAARGQICYSSLHCRLRFTERRGRSQYVLSHYRYGEYSTFFTKTMDRRQGGGLLLFAVPAHAPFSFVFCQLAPLVPKLVFCEKL
ncbi:hypothetical protein METBIDRAFT_118282 [Metschnikowia bicuspidata var. bicuspidata NRRL YB-4993]|uniref:Uncharacterized protein n=1 Tax=Metschnikowia bicuspidata var. bicuspidata NRRL YB-4993 TaxID=869754 RepID=A0A1A0HJF6_9ASCO|nr:hypothetical protein METBIDRAFT_118282 [Metschnikowia bicuspidata var. bicuspidata NRRL YB-4993]OBA24131.1 hypothetical protein METBIDRAFT_118282 [Metschnikowia bicuspidata var. bicuspidata NRRL YB-4993]